ncbi:MarR family winged helix-turn-helix transcriptional regulator [Chlorogloeopsis fritschii]|uniref:MarR family winged helix-turn-helix transcriptional regulator n=1 Tax=Chlorogloeopsis fritschii TaxID=1124 RepID=UPI003C6BF723
MMQSPLGICNEGNAQHYQYHSGNSDWTGWILCQPDRTVVIQKQCCDHLSCDRQSNRIDRLEQAELVRRIPDPRDRRGILIELTDKGFDLIEKAVEAHVVNEHRILSVLAESERETFTQLLRKLLVSFEE